MSPAVVKAPTAGEFGVKATTRQAGEMARGEFHGEPGVRRWISRGNTLEDAGGKSPGGERAEEGVGSGNNKSGG